MTSPTSTTTTVPLHMFDLLFLDIETSGLNPFSHDIIEIAAKRTTHQFVPIKEISMYVAFDRSKADPEALKINGYDPDAWINAISIEEALFRLGELLEWPGHGRAICVGHNPSFDVMFIRCAAHRALEKRETVHGLPQSYLKTLGRLAYAPQSEPIFKYILDTATLGWPLLAAGIMDKPSLSNLCNFYGVSNDGAHTALADVRRTEDVFKRLMSGPPIWMVGEKGRARIISREAQSLLRSIDKVLSVNECSSASGMSALVELRAADLIVQGGGRYELTVQGLAYRDELRHAVYRDEIDAERTKGRTKPESLKEEMVSRLGPIPAGTPLSDWRPPPPLPDPDAADRAQSIAEGIRLERRGKSPEVWLTEKIDRISQSGSRGEVDPVWLSRHLAVLAGKEIDQQIMLVRADAAAALQEIVRLLGEPDPDLTEIHRKIQTLSGIDE